MDDRPLGSNRSPFVGKRQTEHTLFLEVSLMDARKRLHQHCGYTEETGLHRCVFTRAALSIVGVTYNDRGDTRGFVFALNGRHFSVLAGHLILDRIRFVVEAFTAPVRVLFEMLSR